MHSFESPEVWGPMRESGGLCQTSPTQRSLTPSHQTDEETGEEEMDRFVPSGMGCKWQIGE